MNNACKMEEVEQPTFKDFLMELNKLKLENELLKADKQQLTKERDEWKEGFTILHNIMEEQKKNDNKDDIGMLNEYEEEYLCGCESEETFDDYNKALENISTKRFN